MVCTFFLQVTSDQLYVVHVFRGLIRYLNNSQRVLQRLLLCLCACELDWATGPGDRSLSSAVWVAGSMSIPIYGISPALRKALLDNAVRVLHRHISHSAAIDINGDGKSTMSSARMLCNVLWGLAKVGYRWDDLTDALQETIPESVHKLRSAMNSADVG